MEHEGPSQVEVRSEAVGEGYYPDQDANNFSMACFAQRICWSRETDGLSSQDGSQM